MHAHKDHYIHELTIDTILELSRNGAWKVENQSITSALTNTNDWTDVNPEWTVTEDGNTAGVNAFSDIQFGQTVKRLIDVGGGKFDGSKHYMKQKHNIDVMIWDPYNRSHAHNEHVKKEVVEQAVDAATSFSVLNVIPEVEARLAHINTLKAALKINAKAYFKIWAGESILQGSYLPSSSTGEYQANAYADRFLSEIELVFGEGNVTLDKKIPNLIVAVKTREAAPQAADILRIQEKSKKELAVLEKKQNTSRQKLYVNMNVMKIAGLNFTFFTKAMHQFIQNNKDNLPRAESNRRRLV